MPPNHFESEVESFLEGSHGDRTHIKRADHHTVTPLCGTLLALLGLVWVRARKSSPSTRKMAQNGCFMARWANFFAEMRLEGPRWASFFAAQQSWDPAGRVCCAVCLAPGPFC